MERQFLYEAESGHTSLDLLKYKYPQSVISHRVLETLYQEDPSPDKSLFDWMVQQNIATAHHEDVNNQVVVLVKQFFIFQDKMKIRDIHFFHDLDTLQHELSYVRAHLSKAEQKKFKVEEGRVLYEDTHYKVLKPKDMNEVCNSGYDTPWCSSKNHLPTELNDHVAYVIHHKQLKAPEPHLEDYEAFSRQQQRYWTLRKLLVFISKHFKGTAQEADLDDYLLIDAAGEERDESLSELSTPHIERVVFDDFEGSDNKDKLKRELELPDLEVIEEWCNLTEATLEQRRVLTERYHLLSEQYQNPELTDGDRVELIYMKDSTTRKPQKGERGEVVGVEQTPHGVQYLMKWEKGSTMALYPDTDVYRKL
jgi:hypothetical protein